MHKNMIMMLLAPKTFCGVWNELNILLHNSVPVVLPVSLLRLSLLHRTVAIDMYRCTRLFRCAAVVMVG